MNKTKTIKQYGELIVLAILLIFSIWRDGYILGMPIHSLLIYLSIVLLITSGIKKIKDKDLWGWVDIFISVGLLFIIIKDIF